MASADYYIRENDTLPLIGVTCELADGSIADLTGGNPKLKIRKASTGVEVVNITADVVGAPVKGQLQAHVGPLTEGFYLGKFVVTFASGGEILTFPNNSDILIQVYAGQPGRILTGWEDYNAVRAYLGLDPLDFTDDAIKGLMFLQGAELVIRKIVNQMSADTNGAVPTVAQIMAEPPVTPATDDDKLALRLAVGAYIAYQFGPSATNAINTSVTVGKQTVDRGGIGTQWEKPMEIAFATSGMYLQLITGWPNQTQTTMMLSGPTSSGARPDTVSGFWIC